MVFNRVRFPMQFLKPKAMKKTTPKQNQELNYYFIPRKNDYGLTEYICVIKIKGMHFQNGPRYKTDWCSDMNIRSSEFDSKVKED